MANIHGNELGIYIDSHSGTGANGADLSETSYQLVACATSCSLNLSNATIETTCKASTTGALDDASVRHTIAGQQSWNMSVDGLVDLTADGEGAGTKETGFADLMDLALARTDVYVAFSTGVDSDSEYWGKGFISSIDVTAGVDDFATYSATIEGNGDLAKREVDYTA